MGYLLGIIWCALFGGVAIWCSGLRKKTAHFRTFNATVTAIYPRTTERQHIAVLQGHIPEIGEFEIEFQDIVDFSEGKVVACMWDGRDPATAAQDLRKNQLLANYFSIFMIAVMVVVLLGSLLLS